MKLLASATSPEAVIQLINKFWYSKDARLVEIVPLQWQVYQGDKRMEGFQVRLVKGRYRFEGSLCA